MNKKDYKSIKLPTNQDFLKIATLQKKLNQQNGNINVYRSIRIDEYNSLLNRQGIISRCSPCPGEPCCNITISAHINSGSRAVTKSRFISATLSEKIAAIWSSNSSGNPTANYSTYYIKMEIPMNRIIKINRQTNRQLNLGLGDTALNAAKASHEVIIDGDIDMSYVKELYQTKQIPKKLQNEFKNINCKFFTGKKRKVDVRELFVVSCLIHTF
jgi:hypothetical protein